MIRIGICDDIYDARMQLQAALEQIFEARGLQSFFVEFSSGELLFGTKDHHLRHRRKRICIL